jgi:hypothetical protein
VVLIVLLVAVAFLVRSMSKHLKRVPATFDPDELAAAERANAPADPADPADDALDRPEPADSSAASPVEPKPESKSGTEAR